MKTSALACLFFLLCAQPADAQYKTAVPGYHFEFPRDHLSHSDFQTEWWYYTGNLTSADGHRFGFELTFFRQAINPQEKSQSAWDIHDLYLAHLALSDLDGAHFYHSERTNRAGPGIAGVDLAQQRIWNGNWQITWKGADMLLRAVDEQFTLQLTLSPQKPPVIHGENGVSQKAAGPGRASYYISFTRLQTTGAVTLAGKSYQVSGLAWMDHEFFTHQLEAAQTGWDWFSIQLNDNTELMLYRLRRKDGSLDPFSAGTFIDAQGNSTHLRASDFSFTPQGATWTSPATSAAYPIQWKINIPKFDISLEITTPLAAQELTSHSNLSPNYWEGSISISGRRGITLLTGSGYLEMTGYDRPIELPH